MEHFQNKSNTVTIDREAQKHLNAYIEYNYSVGQYDKQYSPLEFENFKKNQRKNAKKRVFVSWVNDKGKTCKNIGPATKCFCDDRFKDHEYMNPNPPKKVACKNPACKCKQYSYIPVHGSQDLRCFCKHSYRDHTWKTKKCKKCGCTCFQSSWSCTCGQTYNQHKTVIQTYAEKVKNNQPMGEVANILMDPMVQAMQMGMGPAGGHGLESFSDMVDGAQRFGTKIEEMEQRRVS